MFVWFGSVFSLVFVWLRLAVNFMFVVLKSKVQEMYKKPRLEGTEQGILRPTD